jgi:hypothetical protein
MPQLKPGQRQRTQAILQYRQGFVFMPDDTSVSHFRHNHRHAQVKEPGA